MIDSLETFKKDMWDFWECDLFHDCPEDALQDYNKLTANDWQELYINHIEKQIDSLNYDLTVDLRWLIPQERIEKSRDLKAYKARLKTLKRLGIRS